MCGIVGFTWRDEDLARRMCEVIAHRGPDQSGVHPEDSITLGHRRLSILDLSENGRQPMVGDDGTTVLVFNGEIYNYPELRSQLESHGCHFRSRCDTEVILHAYARWGMESVHHLRGMFAFCLWDRAARRLWLVRDRLGIKPLYYHIDHRGLIFASEIKAILQDRGVPRKISRQALYDYLGFEFVPAPATMFDGIYKLPAGHQLVWENGVPRISSYWDLSFKSGPRRTVAQAAEEVRESLSSCVRSHLLSDVPVGIFLSGGLDSSALAALMRQHISGTLRTFTIGYPDKSFSELDYADIVARHIGAEHHVLMIEGLDEARLEESIHHLDEPMTDLSAIPLMLLCAEARKHATVVLSGEGGDEVFAGYDRFKASRINRWYACIPAPVRRHIVARAVSRLPDQRQKKGAFNMLKRFIEGSELDSAGRHLRWQYFLQGNVANRLLTQDFRDGLDLDPFRQVREHDRRSDATDPVNRELYLDTRFMMPDSVLMKVDKMSMRSSLEVRVPMLDHGFVELAASMPGNIKLRGTETKHVFREALTGLLPPHIVRRGKQGYSLPVKNLLRDQLRPTMIRVLHESRLIRSCTSIQFVDTLIREHLDQVHNHNHILWSLMNAALWFERFLPGA